VAVKRATDRRYLFVLSLAAVAFVLCVIALRGIALEQWHIWHLSSSDIESRRLAAEKLAQIGTMRSFAKLLEMSESLETPRLRFALRQITARYKKEAISPLLDALQDQSWQRREAAAQAMGEIGPAAVEAVPSLLEALDSKEELLRKSAASSLARILDESILRLLGEYNTVVIGRIKSVDVMIQRFPGGRSHNTHVWAATVSREEILWGDPQVPDPFTVKLTEPSLGRPNRVLGTPTATLPSRPLVWLVEISAGTVTGHCSDARFDPADADSVRKVFEMLKRREGAAALKTLEGR
jgi:HEAT repeat protein